MMKNSRKISKVECRPIPSAKEWVHVQRQVAKAASLRRRQAMDAKKALQSGLEINPGPSEKRAAWVYPLLSYLRQCACDTSCRFVRRRRPVPPTPVELEVIRTRQLHMRTMRVVYGSHPVLLLQFMIHGWCETYWCAPTLLRCDAEIKRLLLLHAGIEPNPGPQTRVSNGSRYVRLGGNPGKKDVHQPGDYANSPGPACPNDSKNMQGVKRGRVYVCPVCHVTIVKGEHPSKGLLLDEAEAQARGLTVAQLQDCEAFLMNKPECVQVTRKDGTAFRTRAKEGSSADYYRPATGQAAEGRVCQNVAPKGPVPPKPLCDDEVGTCHASSCEPSHPAVIQPVIEVAWPVPSGTVCSPACQGGNPGTIAELPPCECPKPAPPNGSEGGGAVERGQVAPAPVPEQAVAVHAMPAPVQGPAVGGLLPGVVAPPPGNPPQPAPGDAPAPAPQPGDPPAPPPADNPGEGPTFSPEPTPFCIVPEPEIARLTTMRDPAHSGLVFNQLRRARFHIDVETVRWSPEVSEAGGERKEKDARLPGLRGAQVVPGAYHTQLVRRGQHAHWTWRVAAYPVLACLVMMAFGLSAHGATHQPGRVGPAAEVLTSLFLASTVAAVASLCYVSWRLLRCVLCPFEYTQFHHVPSISAMMVLQNMASCREDFAKNLPTLFLRHAGSLNVPSSHIPLLQEGCIAAALLNYDILLDEKEHPQDFRVSLRPTEGYSYRPVE